MALIENKLIKYVLVLSILGALIWIGGNIADVSIGWKIKYSIGAAIGAFLYIEGYLTNLRQRR